MIKRKLESILLGRVDYRKAIIVLGPRQVGKTTLLRNLASQLATNYLQVNGDNPAERMLWANPSLENVKRMVEKHNIILIDEAQRIENIGLTVKMLLDAQMEKQVFVSGSSALELSSTINEPMTGRKWEYQMFPIAWSEMKDTYSYAEIAPQLENFLIYGMYPEVLTHPGDRMEILRNLSGSYLYKDILEMGGIRKPDLVLKLLQALSWQLGHEVSYHELAQTIGADKETVLRYIDLLEKNYVIFRLDPLSRNPRNEITTSRKVYFYDNGVRNAIIDHFNPISSRNDVGALWENFVIAERKKIMAYQKLPAKQWFWRSKGQAEIDYIEEINGELFAYDMKWNENAKVRFSKTFTNFYTPKEMNVINRMNYMQWME